MCTPDTEIFLATTAKIMTKDYTWPVFKHHNTVDFFVCLFFRNTAITLTKVYTRRTSGK